MIKCVVFDLDNTLYDYDLCHGKAMAKLEAFTCGEYGITKEGFDEIFGRAQRRVKEQLSNTGASHNRILYMQLFLEELGRKPVEKALDMYDVYWNTMLDTMRLFPYVKPLFNDLKNRDIKIAILTDLTAHIQHRKLRKLGIADDIDILVTSEEVGEEKPSAHAFDLVIKKTSFVPCELLMVGDSQQKDIDGAISNGMTGLLFTKDLSSKMYQKCLRYINGQMD